MSISFDVLTQPWIPVVDKDGKEAELGLLDALSQAHQWRRIHHPSPLVEYSIYRFLVIFLMDAFRPQERFDLEDLLAEGQFDRERLENYVAVCQQEGVRFDLFDPERPFLQVKIREDEKKNAIPASKLDFSIPSGHNHVHFDHISASISYTPGETLQHILTQYFFPAQGGQGYKTGLDKAPPWYVWIEGETLFQELVNNMISAEDTQFPYAEPPVLWRKTDEIEQGGKVIRLSLLSAMLFPCRRISLLPNPDGTVSQVIYKPGLEVSNELKTAWKDPHVVYITNSKGKESWKPGSICMRNRQGELYWKDTEDAGIWRNLSCLLNKDNTSVALYKYSYLQSFVAIRVYGVKTKQASPLEMNCYDMVLPASLSQKTVYIDWVQVYLDRMERLGEALFLSLRAKENDPKDPKNQKGMIPYQYRMSAKTNFYAACHRILLDYLPLIITEADLNELMRRAMSEMASSARTVLNQTIAELNHRGARMRKLMDWQQRQLEKAISRMTGDDDS